MTQLQTARHSIDAATKRNWHYVVPEAGTDFDAILEPGFWAHVAAKLAPGDWIEVDDETGAYTALLKVRDAGKLYAKVGVVVFKRYDEHVDVMQSGPSLEGHEVKWRGPLRKWCVCRGADVLKDGMAKPEAYSWLAQYAKSVT